MLGLGRTIPDVAIAGNVRGAFSPLSLFASAQAGAWYDPSDLTTLWQDSARTTPVTAHGNPVGCIDDKSGNGNHAIQATAANRPLYQVSGTEKFLLFDGSNDFLADQFGAAINMPWGRVSAIRQVTWTLGRRVFGNFSATLAGILYQNGTTPDLRLHDGSSGPINAGLAVGANGVITERHIAAASQIAVNNGAYVTANSGSNSIDGVTIGADGGGTNPSNMRFYGTVMRASLTDAEIALLRTYHGAKVGVPL